MLPVLFFDLAIFVYHSFQPSDFLGIVNVEQYWHSRKVFEVLYEAFPQLLLQAVIFANSSVSSRWTLATYVVSFLGSSLG